MAKTSGSIKLLMWIGVVLFFVWFLVFSLAPQSILVALDFTEIEGYFLRIFGIFPLGWAVLFILALKDIEKNIAIINGGIITSIFMIVANIIFHFAVENITSWFSWLSVAVLFGYIVLLFLMKPKAA
jgi:hypothetical protein